MVSTTNMQDYQIYQRDGDGFVTIPYRGTMHHALADKDTMETRVMREEDNLTVIPWTQCHVTRRENECDFALDLRLPEGGLYRVETIEMPDGWNETWAPRVAIHYHIGVGDIYVMAGQSNMTGYGRDSAYDPPMLGVHAFTRAGKWALATQPLSDSLDSIYGYDENSTGSSPALAFGRLLHESLHIPIGLVPTAVGASNLYTWDPATNALNYSRMRAMLHDAGRIKGMIWYQGCGEACPGNIDNYLEEFTRIVGLWRAEFGENMPILTVQLNRWTNNNNHDLGADRGWGKIREAQRQAARTIPGVFVVPSLDLSTSDGIHNNAASNVVIGERLARTALAGVYGKPGQVAPTVTSAERIDDTHLRVRVSPSCQIYAMDNLADGMEVEDKDGFIDCKNAHQVHDTLIVDTVRPYSLPATFNYGWRCHPSVYTVKDFTGMPMLSCYHVPIEETKEEEK